jgi:2-iminobutanoate/2-iminopropanoate deaminase
MDLTTMAAHVEHLFAAGAPKPIAPFSHATAWGPLLFVTGQMPIIAETGEYVRGTCAEQTDAVMRNLETMLKAAGSAWSRVLHARSYRTDFSKSAAVNAAYERWVEKGKLPARTCLRVTALVGGADVESALLAVRG